MCSPCSPFPMALTIPWASGLTMREIRQHPLARPATKRSDRTNGCFLTRKGLKCPSNCGDPASQGTWRMRETRYAWRGRGFWTRPSTEPMTTDARRTRATPNRPSCTTSSAKLITHILSDSRKRHLRYVHNTKIRGYGYLLASFQRLQKFSEEVCVWQQVQIHYFSVLMILFEYLFCRLLQTNSIERSKLQKQSKSRLFKQQASLTFLASWAQSHKFCENGKLRQIFTDIRVLILLHFQEETYLLNK